VTAQDQWLRAEYEAGRSTYDLARELGCDPKTVWSRLRRIGVATRPRGLNLKGAHNYMLQGRPNPFAGRQHTEETKKRLSEAASVPKPYLRGQRNGMAGRTGSGNPNWRGGTTPERQALYAEGPGREWAKTVYARDGYVCVRCGASKRDRRSLHAHHIQPWSSGVGRFDLENGVTLCRDCHAFVHSRKNTEREFIRG
jgi:hypothetical protein